MRRRRSPLCDATPLRGSGDGTSSTGTHDRGDAPRLERETTPGESRRNGGGPVTPRSEVERLVSAADHAGFTAARRLMQTDSCSSLSELGSFSAGTRAAVLALRRALV